MEGDVPGDHKTYEEGLSADLFEFIYARGRWVKGYASRLAAAEEAARLAT